MKVLICASGTGGGIYPGLAAAIELRKLGLEGEQLTWIGTRGEMEESLVPRAGIQLETISGGGFVGLPPHVMIKNGVKLALGFGRATQLISRFKPDVMLITGGYITVPVAIAAWIQRIPICIYLPDVEPGSAIKFGLQFAEKVACTTDGSRAFIPAKKVVVTGYPVRRELREAVQLSHAEALARFDLTPERQTLFVFGGSRGARSINRTLMANLPELTSKIQIIHISGNLMWAEVKENENRLSEEHRKFYRPYPYLHEEMGAAFRAADLVVARAGASMLGETPAFGLPSILIPYPHAWRYQKVNADYLVERGAAVRLDDEQLPTEMLPAILNTLKDKKKLAQMSSAAKVLDKPDAAVNLAQLILTMGKRSAQGVGT